MSLKARSPKCSHNRNLATRVTSSDLSGPYRKTFTDSLDQHAEADRGAPVLVACVEPRRRACGRTTFDDGEQLGVLT